MASIYISFTKDGQPSTKQVQADCVAPGVYLIAPCDYDRTTEQWEFEPGTKVICDTFIVGSKTLFLAIERVEDHVNIEPQK